MKFLVPTIKVVRKAFGVSPAEMNRETWRFFHGIEKGQVTSDDHGMDLMGYKNKESFVKYKSRLSKWLINKILSSDLSNCTDLQRARIECSKKTLVVRIFIWIGLRAPGISLAERTLPLCVKHGFVDSTMHLSNILSMHYATKEGDFIKAQKVREVFLKSLYDSQMIHEAEWKFIQILKKFRKKKVYGDSDVALVKDSFDYIKSKQGTVDSADFNYYYFVIKLFKHELCREYDQLIETARDAFKYFDELHFDHNTRKSYFISYLIHALNQTDQARDAIEESDNFRPLNLNNGALFNYRRICSFLNLNMPQLAKSILDSTRANPQFDSIASEYQDMLTLSEVFIDLLLGTAVERQLETIKKFRKDPQGMGITFNVIKLCIVALNDVQRLEEHKPRTEAFIRNNLNDRNRRSELFLKMIHCLPYAGFSKKKWAKSEDYWNEMIHLKGYEVGQSSEVELILYEKLWLFLVDNCVDQKFYFDRFFPAEVASV